MDVDKPTDSQMERLALLAEECGEAVHIIGKIMRHGYSSYDPTKAYAPINRAMLENELGDILFAIELLCASGDVDEEEIEKHRIVKAHKVWQYLHHQHNARRAYGKRFPFTILKATP